MQPDPIVFAPLLIGASLLFCWSCYTRLGLVALGGAEDRFSNPGQRLKAMFSLALLQQRVLSRPFGLNHLLIFWSFLVLALANGEFLLAGIFPPARFSLLPAAWYGPLLTVFDLVSLAALVAVCVAACRRAINPPYREARSLEAFGILALIGVLMIAYFGLHGAEIAAGTEPAAAAMPVSSAAGRLLGGHLGASQLGLAGACFWWLHAAALLFFLNYLPFSKHLHILAALPNCYLKELDGIPVPPREEFVEGGRLGAGRIDDFTWKDLFDSFSCTECGRCQQQCPATTTGKPLNPRLVMHSIKENLLVSGPLIKAGGSRSIPLVGEGGQSVAADAIWSCTSCAACLAACPVCIEQLPKLTKLRRHQVQMHADFPRELLLLFENLEQRSNPWGIAPAERTKWSGSLQVPTYEAGRTEYLLYVGCSGSFDPRSKQVTLALAQILNAAGVSWGILGKEEKCCGDSLRRLGNEYLFDQFARDNVAAFQARGVTKVITQCPHCFTTLKNDYRQYGLEIEVIPHAEFIEGLLREGRLQLQEVDAGSVVFHDSCYLGRHNGVYQAPRAVLELATGNAPLEMRRNREQSFCCGAGGGRMWLEEHLGERINLNRVEEALDSHPDTICVTCPYCMTMIEDGVKELASGMIEVRDVAEVVARGLRS
ncbi:electron transfer flavoprotein [Geomonas limicola]|uniref:Electron transfer flavoprotein n=1 Tax=Geomonas limicola TaxID=2740186 RepID=A0A6V8N3Z2_9BACT|nr:(Fe-S)-binding protein [Geomonas limicola]GFO66704.1 electron transfer flavoprotein [Geomonas limicola]